MRHPELFSLAIAHIDCDAFFASVEKRDRPELAGAAGAGRRRHARRGDGRLLRRADVWLRSAMPMFKALKACPDAVVIRPDFAKYSAAARAGARVDARLTPLVQPLSIDEAVLDLSGTEALHGAPPAAVLARFALAGGARRSGVTVSIGLAPNRLLAKIAAGRDKPRGFAVLGAEARRRAGELSRCGCCPASGPALARRLAALGITHLGHLQALDDRDRAARGSARTGRRWSAARAARMRGR